MSSRQLLLEDLYDNENLQNSSHSHRSVKELQFSGTYTVNKSSIYAVVTGDRGHGWLTVDLLLVPRSASTDPDSWYLPPSTAPALLRLPWLNYPVVDIARALLLCRFNDAHSSSNIAAYERHSERVTVLDGTQDRIYLVTQFVTRVVKPTMVVVKAVLEHAGTNICDDGQKG